MAEIRSAANGTGMSIGNIGHTTLHTPVKNLQLNNILHVPSTHKNLVSVHRLTSDNNTFLEFHPDFFVIKDQKTKKVLHQGRCKTGLYPLSTRPAVEVFSRQAYGVNKPSSSKWHSRLGHPAPSIVDQVIKNNSLPLSSDKNIESVCDACEMAKSH